MRSWNNPGSVSGTWFKMTKLSPPSWPSPWEGEGSLKKIEIAAAPSVFPASSRLRRASGKATPDHPTAHPPTAYSLWATCRKQSERVLLDGWLKGGPPLTLHPLPQRGEGIKGIWQDCRGPFWASQWQDKASRQDAAPTKVCRVERCVRDAEAGYDVV